MARPVAIGCVGAAVVIMVAATFVPRAVLGPKPGVPRSAGSRPHSTATLTISRPADGSTISGSELNVIVSLTGGTIVQTASTAIRPDTGHLHLSIDGRLVSMTYGTLQIVDVASLAPGPHTRTAEFVAADQAPFNPRVLATTTFTRASA